MAFYLNSKVFIRIQKYLPEFKSIYQNLVALTARLLNFAAAVVNGLTTTVVSRLTTNRLVARFAVAAVVANATFEVAAQEPVGALDVVVVGKAAGITRMTGFTHEY